MSKIKSIKRDNTPPIVSINEIDKQYTEELLKYINDGYTIVQTLDGKTVLRNFDTDDGICVNKHSFCDMISITIHPVLFGWRSHYNTTVICSDIIDKTVYYKIGDNMCTTDTEYWKECTNIRNRRNEQNRDDFYIDYIKRELGYKNCKIIEYPHTKKFIKHILPMINEKSGFKSIRASHIDRIIKVTGKGCMTYVATFTLKAPTKMPCLAFKKYYQMNINELIF